MENILLNRQEQFEDGLPLSIGSVLINAGASASERSPTAQSP
jgi:hypothetical protein